jgi:protein-disulfide isomerase
MTRHVAFGKEPNARSIVPTCLMTHTLLRFLATCATVVACARSDAAPRDSASKSTTPATPAESKAARDSITDLADRGRVMGDPKALLWVIMASDFQCPYCKSWHDTDFQKIVDKYVKTGRVRLAFLNMPLGMHKHAIAAAEAAMCTAVQGRFWPMHDALFAGQEHWESLPNPSPTFESLAGSTGVSLPAWQRCMKEHQTLPLIQADRERMSGAHVNSTPTFFVGDRMLAGADAKLAEAIDAALAGAGSAKKSD